MKNLFSIFYKTEIKNYYKVWESTVCGRNRYQTRAFYITDQIQYHHPHHRKPMALQRQLEA